MMRKLMVKGKLAVSVGVLFLAFSLNFGVQVHMLEIASSLGEANTPSTSTSSTDSWPMFRHDLNHTGYSTSNAPSTNHTLWTYPIGDEVHSSPTVADGKVYVGSHDHNVYCFDASTGAKLWNYATGEWVLSSPAVADGKVYVGSHDHNVYCFDASTGEGLWSYATGNSVQSSPAVAYGKVYIGSNDGSVYCFGFLESDVTIINVTSAKTVIGQGYGGNVAVTAQNLGDLTQNFNVTIYANLTFTGALNFDLTSGSTASKLFVWNTTGFAYGNYTLKAAADIVPEETDIANNNYTCPVPVHVGVPGDISGPTQGVYDGICNMRDIQFLILLFNTMPSSPNWKPNADVNNNGAVNMRDIQIAILNFGKHE
jgi:hypothetical protein